MSPEPALPSLSLERARHQGREAFYAGQPTSANPYRTESPEGAQWLLAWQAADTYRRMLDEHLARQA